MNTGINYQNYSNNVTSFLTNLNKQGSNIIYYRSSAEIVKTYDKKNFIGHLNSAAQEASSASATSATQLDTITNEYKEAQRCITELKNNDPFANAGPKSNNDQLNNRLNLINTQLIELESIFSFRSNAEFNFSNAKADAINKQFEAPDNENKTRNAIYA